MKPSRKAREEAGGKNYDGFSLPPHSCYVIGVDTQHGQDHPLYKSRAADVAAGRKPYDERMLRSLREHGVLEPIRVQLVQVAEDDSAWPTDLRGRLVHVVVLGGHRIVHFRKVVEAAPVKDNTAWQVRCVLDHNKDPRAQFSVQIDENVCRRVLDDEELAQQIMQGLNIGLTLDEMADRLGITMAKAKRLRRRAEGVPEKPKAPPVERVSGKVLSVAAEKARHRDVDARMSWHDLASLIDVVRGRVTLEEATAAVQRFFEDTAS